MKTYFLSLQSEWQKTRHSAASWLVIIGAVFIPFIMIVIQSIYPERFSPTALGDRFWSTLFRNTWESTAVLLLPVGVILATSLITQLEFRNNTWKQVFASPQSLSTLFLSKLTVILIMLLQFFVINGVAIVASAYIPCIYNGSSWPPALPLWAMLSYTTLFFISTLPLVAWQFLISMRFKNFMVGLGIGLGLVVASLFALSWKYGYQFPFSHMGMVYTQLIGQSKVPAGVHIEYLSLIWFAVITIVHYILYLSQKERGA